uniref:helix-turn-helix domain-containing protein n=1 Tax=Herbiconiux daphne TaxID=2970914 RepID=UPI002877EE2A|nr:cupin domain-containing protein [Herbiconiux daphne]
MNLNCTFSVVQHYRTGSRAIEDDIGPRLRAARMAKSLSLRTVAAAVGVSASLISQVETGKTRPSVSTLYALVNFLGISFDELVGEPGTAAAAPRRRAAAAPAFDDEARRTGTIVQQGSDNPVLEMENGVRWERLATGVGGPVDPLLVTYEPGASSSVEGKMMRHSGTEYAYLLSGELTVRVDFDTFVIHPGDSLNFDSVRPHMYVNHGTVPAKGLWFVVGRRDVGDELPTSGVPSLGAADQLNSAVDILQAMDRLS